MDAIKFHFNRIAADYDSYKRRNWYYYSSLKSLLSSLIPFHRRVLEVGCGTGDLLAYLHPKYGYGIDISSHMLTIAKTKYPYLRFSTHYPGEKFEYIFMSDVIEHLTDPLAILNKITKFMTKHSVFICTMANPKWEPILMLAEKLRLKMPEGPHNRINFAQLQHLLLNSGLQITCHDYCLLCPVYLPIISNFSARHLEKYLKSWSFIEYVVAKKK
ncbi:hypothetical protein A3D85_01965 [Candidatus Amesbacteria bacterium RIFCSPHIGHO2_02_FULL_47_9]|uniref:Methyltransferase type 12 domain-containing protein n=1 Tax=Candidatus Amesbacteria bacterium RIFCSPHIGHO2_01_FULL_48_32b TaxID=1797253 RepID=A0A1F4YFX3_9BACT|nr:MAG: hypothetical protein A2876_02555 [Candidatus Amesbacteria bacterium RIFCSPHIGHO2_01_FULL_48_32b]OGD04532.1 MAG: hypothetical protein A3D85_01965 [Candidatus Amesbacteria bacterium RIFCSPHIGHO2_02_FULL_47_9]OGD08097.1 MAG: hypothetical protein A2899_02000 [Candidatus Amesbacteria bacterium RIFCSPLOWO2_01_FULL_49_25]